MGFNPIRPLKNALNTVENTVNVARKAVGQAANEVTGEAANTAKDVFEAVDTTVKGTEKVVGNTAKAAGEAVGNAAKVMGGGAVGNAAKVVGEAVGNVAKVMGGAVGNVAKVMSGAVGNVAKAVGEVVEKVANEVEELQVDYVAMAQGTSVSIDEWKDKMALAEQGLSSANPATRAAAGELKRDLVGQQMALLSEAVYSDACPEGWIDISNDSNKLAEYGLAPADFGMDGVDFRARMFVPDSKVFGDMMQPTLAFKGTTPTSMSDWGNNLEQGLGNPSAYYERAVEIGNKVKGNVNIAGHSLGGGLASAAATASGKETYTFNAAGLNNATISRYNGGIDNNPDITAYHVKSEILTELQTMLPPMPEAKGASIELPTNTFRDMKSRAEGALVGSLIGGPLLAPKTANLSNAVTNHLNGAVNDGMRKKVTGSEANLRKLLGNA